MRLWGCSSVSCGAGPGCQHQPKWGWTRVANGGGARLGSQHWVLHTHTCLGPRGPGQTWGGGSKIAPLLFARSSYHAIPSLWLLREEKEYIERCMCPSCCVTDTTALCLYIQPWLLFSWQIWFVALNIFKVMLLLIVVMLLIFIEAFYSIRIHCF